MFLTSFVGAILKNMEWPVVGESTSSTKLLNVEYVSDPVQIKGSKISKTRAREGGASVFTSFLSLKAAAPAKRAIQQAGKKEGGLGEGIFARLLRKRSPAALLVQSRTQQKSFLFLLEEKIRRAQIRKCEESFFAGWRLVETEGIEPSSKKSYKRFLQACSRRTGRFLAYFLS